jgi:hypothetical protein
MLRFARQVVVAGVVASGCIAMAAGVAAAQGGYARPKRFQLFAVGGGYFASDIYSGSTAGSKVHVTDSWGYGARLLFFPERGAGLEFGWVRSTPSLEVFDPTAPAQPKDRGTIDVDDLAVNVLFLNHRGPAAGYFTLGVGSSILTPHPTNGVNADARGRFAWNFGIGVIYETPGALVARIDARYRGMDTNINTGNYTYCDFYGFCYTYASDIYSSGEVTAALGFRF